MVSKGTNEKIITQLVNTSQFDFPGYENVLLTFNKLKQIIDDPQTYADWHIALSSINAIYAITDCSNGKIYIGSSYNKMVYLDGGQIMPKRSMEVMKHLSSYLRKIQQQIYNSNIQF